MQQQQNSDFFEIRKAAEDDFNLLQIMAGQMGHTRNQSYFEHGFNAQRDGEREIYIAYYQKEAAGFVMLNWAPKYAYFKSENMPEIQDLNVLPRFRGRGIGRALIQYCEAMARSFGHAQMGLGVGLTASFGPAQRLYVKMGYVPDGYGVTHDRQYVTAGEFKPVDDDMSLMMVKKITGK
jgi:GNAT superfamily N-acetyltransferase